MSASRSRLRVDLARQAWRARRRRGARRASRSCCAARPRAAPPPVLHAARGPQRARRSSSWSPSPIRSPAGPARWAARRTVTAPALTTASARRRPPLLREIARQYSLTLVSEWPIEQLQMHCVLFRIPPGTTREAMIERLQGRQTRAHRAAAQRIRVGDQRSRRRRSTIRTRRLQSNVSALDVVEAHDFSRGAGIRVAIIDTGVDTLHPDLAGRTQLTRNYIDDDEAAFRTDRHGTQVAGPHRSRIQQRHRHRRRRAGRQAHGVQGLLAGFGELAPAAATRSPSRRRSPMRWPRRRRSST